MSKEEYDDITIRAYVNGGLDSAKSQELDAAAESDPELASRIAVARGIKKLVLEGQESHDPGSFGWARLSRSIDQLSRETEAGNIISKRFSLWQTAAVAALSVVTWQLFSGVALKDQPVVDAYLPASESEVDDLTVRVIFRDNLSVETLSSEVLELGAKITDGPSAIGIYTLSFDTVADKEEALSALHEKRDIFEQVE